MQKILAIVLAGGEGSRLKPLSATRCKPAVGFHGHHRIVDFVLSNLANSGVPSIWVLVQYEPRALIEHLARTWQFRVTSGQPSVTVLAPQTQQAGCGFLGTADAVFQNIARIEAEQPDVVAIFSADHVYRMDVRQMLAFHQASGAEATVATLPVPLHQCHRFGIVQTDARRRITGFIEKPRAALPFPGSNTYALASMGNYLFETEALLQALRTAHHAGGTDFGRHLLPAMVKTHRLAAYDFAANVVPGVHATEERAYWRDVGTLDAWFEAQFDAVGVHPRFQLTNPQWPIHTAAEPAGPALVEGGAVRHSVLACGSVVEAASLERAIIRGGVHVHAGARLENCVVLEGSCVGQGAHIRHAIIGEDNDVPRGERIGLDLARDRERFTLTAGGIVAVPAGFFSRGSVHPSGAAAQRHATGAGVPLAVLAGQVPSHPVPPSQPARPQRGDVPAARA